jgi:hypothetical protein
MTVTDELLRNNERYAESFDKGELPLPPAKGVAVVACMDFVNPCSPSTRGVLSKHGGKSKSL